MNLDFSQMLDKLKNTLSEKLADNTFVEKIIKELIEKTKKQIQPYLYLGVALYAVIVLLLIWILYKLYR